jgi:[acyl-carrier-protein] S-malonyltransferase
MNVTANYIEDEEDIKPLLIEQMCGRVRWTESIQKMTADGITSYIELGAGKVLGGLIKRIAPDAKIISVQGVNDIQSVLDLFKN